MKIAKTFLAVLALFVAVATTVWAYSYDITIPVKGKTLASTKLQRDSLFTIYSFAHRVAEQSCQNFSIIDTKVTQPKKDGAWEEVWTIKACSRVAEVPVNFTDTTYAVNPMKVKYTAGK